MANITRLLPKDLQKLLIQHGYDLGSSGADGVWGDKTETALEVWFSRAEDLCKPIVEPEPGESIVPADWLPDCDMDKIVNHWTAGSYDVSATDREHYHFIIGGNLVLVRGDHSIKANVSTSDGDGYAGHTSQFNTKAIGIAVAAMAGAIESPFNPGRYPVTKEQWLMSAQVAAECCRKYSIKVTPTTVLQHGEVQKNTGVPQKGKWDVNKLPWEPGLSPSQVCAAWRAEVSRRI